jgi:hypothetical protein
MILRLELATASALPEEVVSVMPLTIIIITAAAPVNNPMIPAASWIIPLTGLPDLLLQVAASGLSAQGPHTFVVVLLAFLTDAQCENKSNAITGEDIKSAALIPIRPIKVLAQLIGLYQ